MSEKSKMLNGEYYDAGDESLVRDRLIAKTACHRFNNLSPGVLESPLSSLLDHSGSFHIEAPFYFDYGYNIKLGDHFYANHGCIILDVCLVTIGDNVLLGPGVHIYTAMHPLSPEERLSGKEFGKPVTIGSNVWIGGSAVICPGVTIGDNSVIGAGSVVTRDVQANVVVAGNPARVIRRL